MPREGRQCRPLGTGGHGSRCPPPKGSGFPVSGRSLRLLGLPGPAPGPLGPWARQLLGSASPGMREQQVPRDVPRALAPHPAFVRSPWQRGPPLIRLFNQRQHTDQSW